MRTCFKSVIRRPVQHILLMLFLGIVSFGFLSHVAEYLAVTQAVDELSGYYKAIGYLGSADGEVTEGVHLLQDCDLIAINDVQRACSGTMQDLYNTNLDGISSMVSGYGVSEFFVLGKLIEKKHQNSVAIVSSELEHYRFQFQILERYYGYPDYVPENEVITVTYFPEENAGDWYAVFNELQLDATYAFKAYYNGGSGNLSFSLRPAIPDGDWFLSAGDSRIAEVVEADAAQEINRHRLYMDGTKDMSSLPFTQESSHDGYLIDGRWLTAADDEAQNPVCVISQDFAEIRGLSVGDSLTISLRDEQLDFGYYPLGTTLDGMDFTDDPTITFTIVGIFNRAAMSNFGGGSSQGLTVYIPNSCIPAEYATIEAAYGYVYEAGYSFVLNHPDSQDAFLQQYRKALEDVGCTVHFVENGWTAFSSSAQSLSRSTSYGAAMFAVMQLLTLVLAAVFYFKLHQKEFSIARALGVSSSHATRWHLLPMLLLGMISLGVGSVLGWNHAMGQIQVTLADLIREGQEVKGHLSVGIPVALCVFSIGLLMLVTFLCYASLSRHSVLDALYETRKNQVPTQKSGADSERDTIRNLGVASEQDTYSKSDSVLKRGRTLKLDASPKQEAHLKSEKTTLVPTSQNEASYLKRFIWRHIFRSRGRTLLTLASAVIFVLALGWIQRSIDRAEQNINDMYENILVEAEIAKRDSGFVTDMAGFISSSAVDAICSNEFVKESNLVAAMNVMLTYTPDATRRAVGGFTLCGITSTDFLNRNMGNWSTASGNGEITYQDGWDASMFDAERETDEDSETLAYPVIIPESFQTANKISFGDKLTLDTGYLKTTVIVRGRYSGEFNGLGDIPEGVALMPHWAMREFYGERPMYYSVAKFVLEPTRNRELDTFRPVADQIMENDTESPLAIKFIIWDEELRMAVEPMEKNLALMKLFYPIAQIAVILGAGIITLLSLMQKDKTAFLLHVLGIPSRTVQFVLGSEQLLLGVIGSVCGVFVIIVSGSFSVRTLPCVIAYLLGLILGTAVGCVSLTREQKQL